MKKSTYALISLLLLVGLYCAASVSYALDAPHNPVGGVDCDLCHYPTNAPLPPWVTDTVPAGSTPLNQLCASCHYDTNLLVMASKFAEVKTHSSYETGGANEYLMECRTCHNPHLQDQMRALPADGNLDYGSTTSVTASTLTDTSKNWGLNQFADALLIPNTAYIAYSYRITGNTANTLTVEGAMKTMLPYTGPGKPYRIKYGKMVKNSVITPNSGTKLVTFLSNSGTLNSFASTTATVKGVCQVCHTKTKYFLGDGSKLDGGHPATYDANCTVSCHQHKDGFKAGGCKGCHGQSGSTGAPLEAADLVGYPSSTTGHSFGAHPTHAVTLNIGCETCHFENGMPTEDQKITVAFSGKAAGGLYQGINNLLNGYSYNAPPVTFGATETCSSIYCHSSGQSADGLSATPSVNATPNWEDPASGACGTCHKTTTGTTLGRIDTGSHTSHLTSAVTMGCDVCHSGATADGLTYNSTNHVNQSIDVSSAITTSYTKGGPLGNGYGTCSAAACHGSGSPVWGNTSKTGCYRCHGDAANGNAAPGPDTAGDTAATDPQVGAHQAHLKASSNYSNPIACNECHIEPPFVQSAGHITNDATPGVAEVVFGSLALTNPRSVAGTPTYAGGQCSNVYCHDSSRFKNGYAGGTGHIVSWASDTYLGDVVTDKLANCGTCHGNPPTQASGHPNASANTSCSGCHDNVNTAGTGFNTPANHVNGTVESPSMNCYDCHGQSGTDGAPRFTADMMSTLPLGQHGTHVDTKAYSCDTCHSGHNMPATDDKIEIAFTGMGTGGIYDPPAPWQTTPVTKWTYSWTNGPNTQQCDNLYCHSQGRSVYSAPNTTPTWSGSMLADCSSCHSGNAGATTKMASNAHAAHMNDGTVMANKACNTCHNVTVDATDRVIASQTNHVNQVRNVDIINTYDNDGMPSNNWNSGTATCSNVYCHSTGAATPTYKPIAWTATISDCKSCHDYDVASGSIMSTGSHTAHINNAAVIGTNFGCQDCHSTTTNGTSITTPANHINKTRDVSIAGATWISPTCSNVYCHSSGQATPAYRTVPNWGSATNLTCDNCHGTEGGTAFGEPAYTNGTQPTVVENNDNSHLAHVTVAADCARCHADTVDTAGTAIKTGSTLHTNQTKNVNFAAAYDNNSGTNSDNYAPATKTCSAITCHGAGTPMWGGASLTCDQCHLANNTLAGKHGKHYGVTTVAVTADKNASNTSTGTAYEFSCGVCHNATPHSDGNVSANQAAQVAFDSATVALGGSYTPGALAGTDTGGRPWSNGTCNATYCHSKGQSTTTPFGGAGNTTATWNGATMTCEGCHNYDAAATNKMNTGKHAAHMDDGTIMTNVACSACHTSTTSDSTTITNTANHVNKAKDVTIALTYDSDLTSTNNWNSGTVTCSNVYCHSTGAATPTYKPIVWTATISDCKSCHDYDVASGSIISTGSHTAHINNAAVIGTNFGCQDCHSSTTNNGTSITTPANHINKTRDVSIAGATWISPTCSNVYCHSSGQATPAYITVPNWGSATNLTCDSCHGTEGGTAFGEPAYVSNNSHTGHVTAATDCAKCHADTVTTAGTAIKTGSTNHVNQTRNVNFASTYDTNGGSNSDNYNTGSATCSATLCHGATSPAWGSSAPTIATCTKCHGVEGTTTGQYTTNHAAPGYVSVTPSGTGRSLSLATAATDTKVGAHNAHITASGGYASAIACTVCHENVVSAATTSHMDGSTTFAWSAPSNTGGLSPSYNPATNTCSTTYCHGNGIALVNQGTGTAPVWKNTAYITNPGSSLTPADCGVCHQSPPARNHANTAPHPVYALDKCNTCHNHNGSGDARHMNGILEAAGGACNGCHWYDTNDAGAWTTSEPLPSGGLINDVTAWGAHTLHINHLKTRAGIATLDPNDASAFGSASYNAVCGVCHTQNATTNHQNTTRQINFGDGSTAHKFGASAPDYGTTVTRSCSNLDCHFKASPVWSN